MRLVEVFWFLAMILLGMGFMRFMFESPVRPSARYVIIGIALLVGSLAAGFETVRNGWEIGVGVGVAATGIALLTANDVIRVLK